MTENKSAMESLRNELDRLKSTKHGDDVHVGWACHGALVAARAVLAEHDERANAAQALPPSEAEAWRERVSDAVVRFGSFYTIHGSSSLGEVDGLLDEAVRLMSQQPEAPKRLRAGWREDLVAAFRTLKSSFPGGQYEINVMARIEKLLDEAASSAAPEPEPDNAPINDWMVKVANLSLELQRANAIIDALVARKP